MAAASDADISPTPAPAEPGATTAAADEATAPVLIVPDLANDLEPGQMRKSAFLAQLQSAVRSAAEAALAGTDRTTQNCPYIDYWFGYYAEQDNQHIERAVHRYAPETVDATTATEVIALISARVDQAVAVWATTGQITGVPEGVPTEGAGLAPGIEGPPAATSKVFFKARAGGARPTDDPQVLQAQLGAGRPLESMVRGPLESAFGYNFSGVRVHTDATVAQLSSGLNARAFTIGEHVAFGTGEYRPGTLIGDALLAHELAHVVQQGGAMPAHGPLRKTGETSDPMEEDADVSAVGAVLSMWSGAKERVATIARNAMPRLKTGLRLQRCEKKSDTKACKLVSGPTYSPSGTIKATKSGTAKTATFNMSAEFEHDPGKGSDASCCEVRQYILWTKAADIPNHAGFKPAADYSANTWYEDRDDVGKRYGHRTGPYSECISVNHYEDKTGTYNCPAGQVFKGRDDPKDGSGAKTGEWQFQLKAVDVCHGEKVVGTPAAVTVDWNV
jgi:hypothetical protein